MDERKLSRYAELQPFVRKEIESMFSKLLEQNVNKYQIGKNVPFHKHNGMDAPKLPAESIIDFQALPSTPDGVLSPANVTNQGVNTLDINPISNNPNPQPPKVFITPIPVIYSSAGVGPGGSFNLGDAPQGTVLMFANGQAVSGFSQLWVKTLDGWYGFTANLGPL